MVNLILKYIKAPLTAYLPFVTKVDAPVYRISSGEVFSGVGSEKENVSISDNVGKGLYIRQIQQEQVKEKKKFTSCDKEYEITARCKAVFYSFSQDEFIINPDKISARIQGALKKVTFEQYTGSAKEITIDILSASTDFEKIFTEETGKQFEGDNWPLIVSVEFNLNYEDINCVACDIEDSETVVTWTPDLTPENCETKAICEVISKCDVITLLQEQTASLQEQIDNLPQSGLTCTDLPNCQTIIDILQSINDIISGLPSSYFSCADLEFCQTIIDIVSDISDLQTQVGTNTTDISTLQGQVSSLISDLGTLTTTVNNHISDTSNPHNVTLEQARSENSSISGDINANNNTIINLKDAVNPQEPITKIQFDTYVSAVGGNRGAIDCSANPNYPASNKGDRWEVTVAGKIGGPSGINVDVYDEIVCVTASASGDQATVGVNFYIVQGNIERATETTNGYTSYATDAETQGNTENTKTITPLKLYNWFVAKIQSVFVKKGTLTTNYIPKATSSDTIGDSSITDDGTTVSINKKTSITQNTIGTGAKGLSVNFNTIGEAFYMDDNGVVQFKTQAGVTITGANGILNLISNGGVNPYIIFKYANGASTSGYLSGDGNSLVIDTPALKINQLTPSQYLKTDASKNLVSVSAIPATDVTEDSTHRFITDVERLKWNKFSYTDTVLGTVSSGTSNTLSKSVLIPANTLTSGLLNIIGRSVKTGTGSFGWLNIYINTSNSMSGAIHLGQINNAANNTILHWSLSRAIPIQSGSFTAFIINSTSGSNDVITNNVSTVTIDWTVNQYIILSVQANNGAEKVTANFLSVVQY